jgi:hypothetical protein
MSLAEFIKTTKAKLSEGDVYRLGNELVPKVNVKTLAIDLDLEAVGERRGAENLPPLGVKEADEIEDKIIEVLQEASDKTGSRVSEAIVTYNNRLAALDPTGALDEIKDSCADGITNFDQEILNGKDELSVLAEKVAEIKAEILHFKKQNNLRRTAHYPTGGMRWVWYAIIVVIFLAETIANATFLAKANELGVLGAYGESVAISVVNLGIAYFLGSFFFIHLNSK